MLFGFYYQCILVKQLQVMIQVKNITMHLKLQYLFYSNGLDLYEYERHLVHYV